MILRKNIILIILFQTISYSYGQEITIRDLEKLSSQKEWETVSINLLKKGWKLDNLSKTENEISWKYNIENEKHLIKMHPSGEESPLISFASGNEKLFNSIYSEIISSKKYQIIKKTENDSLFYRHKKFLIIINKSNRQDIPTISCIKKSNSFWKSFPLNTKDFIIENSEKQLSHLKLGDFIAKEGGVIFGFSNDGKEAYIIALNDVNRGNGCEWGSYMSDIPGEYPYTTMDWHKAYNDMEGEKNTNAILSYLNKYPEKNFRAAEYARQYNGENKTDWYLPSIGQLKQLSDVADSINPILRTNGGTSIAKAWYWSSTEYSNMFVWVINFSNKDIGRSAKRGNDRVRAVRTIHIEKQ